MIAPCRLDSDDVCLLTTSLVNHPTLATVDLRDSRLGPAALRYLCARGLAANASVTRLDLSLNRVAEGLDDDAIFREVWRRLRARALALSLGNEA